MPFRRVNVVKKASIAIMAFRALMASTAMMAIIAIWAITAIAVIKAGSAITVIRVIRVNTATRAAGKIIAVKAISPKNQYVQNNHCGHSIMAITVIKTSTSLLPLGSLDARQL